MNTRQTTHLWAEIQDWMDHQLFRVSQAQLAERVGVERSAVSQWKLGQSRPKPEHLRELARLTGIPYDRLLLAVVRDMGYLDGEDGGERVRSASMTTEAGVRTRSRTPDPQPQAARAARAAGRGRTNPRG